MSSSPIACSGVLEMAWVSCRLRSGSSVTHAVFISTTPNGSPVADHLPHRVQTGLPAPLEQRMCFVGGLIRALARRPPTTLPALVDASGEQDRVGTECECLHVECVLDTVVGVACGWPRRRNRATGRAPPWDARIRWRRSVSGSQQLGVCRKSRRYGRRAVIGQRSYSSDHRQRSQGRCGCLWVTTSL